MVAIRARPACSTVSPSSGFGVILAAAQRASIFSAPVGSSAGRLPSAKSVTGSELAGNCIASNRMPRMIAAPPDGACGKKYLQIGIITDMLLRRKTTPEASCARRHATGPRRVPPPGVGTLPPGPEPCKARGGGTPSHYARATTRVPSIGAPPNSWAPLGMTIAATTARVLSVNATWRSRLARQPQALTSPGGAESRAASTRAR